MEKRSPYLLIIFVAIALFSGSCSDSFYDQLAGDRITPEQAYQTTEELTRSMGGAVLPLHSFMPKFIILDGLRTDQMDVTAYSDNYFRAINDQNFTVDNPFIDGSDLYKIIVNCNEILANIDRTAEKDKDINDFILHYYKGGVIGLRTWAYFTIIRLYGQAAYIEDNMTSLPEGLNQTFYSKDVMIDTLINQIKPYIHDNSVGVEYVEIGIPGYPNTKAILGELYLEKNDYVNAAIYLKLACESYSNPSTLYKVDKQLIEKAWKTIFIGSSNVGTENIFVIPFSLPEGQVNPLPSWMLYNDQYQVQPSSKLVANFESQIQLLDLQGDLYRGEGVTYGKTDTSATAEKYILKYALDAGDPYSSDIIMSRAADLHLLLAEALNRLGDRKNALILLNSGFNSITVGRPPAYSKWNDNRGIRGRAYLKARAIPAGFTGDTTELVEDFILEERTMELAFEGKRWFDLVRVASRRGNPAYLADAISQKYGLPTEAKYEEIHGFLMNTNNWYLPIK